MRVICAMLTAGSVAGQSAWAAATTTDSVAGTTTITLYAAGSLRESMTAMADAYLAERSSSKTSASGNQPVFKFLFGPSGKLRERIAAGEALDIFASASPIHTDRLLKEGKLRSTNVFASNA
ncbi:MAG TPA: substrate-binding domain-containing protein, partial [Casimicrobium sp.]|nr:substrate-binding domain-containing protein [Casimicrobium sp.]